MFKYTFLTSGIYLISFSFIMKTNNTQSTILFKILPFLIGLFNLLYALKDFKII